MTSMPGARFPGRCARVTARGCSLASAPLVSIAVMAWVPHSASADRQDLRVRAGAGLLRGIAEVFRVGGGIGGIELDAVDGHQPPPG